MDADMQGDGQDAADAFEFDFGDSLVCKNGARGLVWYSTFPSDSEPSFRKKLDKFLDARWQMKGQKFRDNSGEMRRNFYDKHCTEVKVETADGESYVPKLHGKAITDLDTLKAFIVPSSVKMGAVQYFEKEEDLTGEDEGN